MKFNSHSNPSTSCYISIKIKCEELCEVIRLYNLKDKSGHFLQSWNNDIMLFEYEEEYFHGGDKYDERDFDNLLEIVRAIPYNEKDLPEQLHLIISRLFIEIPDAAAIRFKAAIRTAEHIEMISEEEGIQPNMVDWAIGNSRPYNYFVRATLKDEKYIHESNHETRYDSRFEGVYGSATPLLHNESHLANSNQSIQMGNQLPASSDIWDFELNSAFSKAITLTKYKGNEEEVIVPSDLNGYKVQRLARTFEGNKHIRSVVVLEGITSIDDKAFAYCKALISVALPTTLTKIGDEVFWGCENLESVSITDAVTYIGKEAFRYCRSLKEICLPTNFEYVGDSAFTGCVRLYSEKRYLIINDVLFDIRGNRTHIAIPDGTKALSSTSIPKFVKELALPDSCLALSQSPSSHDTFKYASNLEKVLLPNGITKIDKMIFWGYGSMRLNEIIIPESVRTICRSAFSNSSLLKRVIILSGTETIEDGAFISCPKLSTVYLPSSVRKIDDEAFPHRKALKFIAPEGSYAESYARNFGITYSNQVPEKFPSISELKAAFLKEHPISLDIDPSEYLEPTT